MEFGGEDLDHVDCLECGLVQFENTEILMCLMW